MDDIEVLEGETLTEEPEPTTEEPKPDLSAQLEEYRTKYDTLEESHKSLQRKHNKTQEEVKQQSNLRSRLDTLEQSQKLLVAILSERGNVSDVEDMPTHQKTDYIKKYDEILEKQKQQEVLAEKRAKEQTWQEQATTMYERAEMVYGDDIDALHTIRNLIRANDLDLAEKKIAKAEKTKTEPANEEERIEQKALELLKKQGKLPDDLGGASTGSKGRDDDFARYAAGQMSTDEAAKLGLFK